MPQPKDEKWKMRCSLCDSEMQIERSGFAGRMACYACGWATQGMTLMSEFVAAQKAAVILKRRSDTTQEGGEQSLGRYKP